MQRIGKDVIYFETGAGNPVTHRVRAGETFEVETQINAGPWIDELPEPQRAATYRRLSGPNPASGCIHVEGVKPGDLLGVEIGPIELDPVGYTRFGGNNGAMPGWMDIGAHHRVVRIEGGQVLWDDRLRIPARPMLGFVGVAPKNRECYDNAWGGYWGGNMDAPEVCPGTTLLLRAFHEGALLHIGDMHALQGDGEICGAGGIEAGGRAKITCLILGRASDTHRFPRFENRTHVGVIANARPAEDAFRAALCELLRWLTESYRLSLGDAYLLLGQVLEARCTQFVNPTFTYVAKVEKRYLP
jgi:amidase